MDLLHFGLVFNGASTVCEDYEEKMRWQLMCVLDGSCGKVQKKLRLCIVEKRDLASKAISVQVSRPSACCAHSCDLPVPRSPSNVKVAAPVC